MEVRVMREDEIVLRGVLLRGNTWKIEKVMIGEGRKIALEAKVFESSCR